MLPSEAHREVHINSRKQQTVKKWMFVMEAQASMATQRRRTLTKHYRTIR